VLEEHAFERVGGEETIHTDIRVIAATNRDLRAYVQLGKFREDLFFRLNVVDIVLPPLSGRTGDIPLLADRFLKEYGERNGKRIEGLSPDAISLLTAYAWPGNVRELRNTIEKMVVLSRSDRLSARDVPANIREAVKGHAALGTRPPALMSGSLADTERRKIMAVLEKNGGNRTRAADELGISRRTLHRKLRDYKEQQTEEPVPDEEAKA